ncbi:MAG: GDSL-type esterase/lipase family protein [Bacteroidaceae bacterium]|nr:GDSL-type esterase/lipase family protein [Bacteroidaceae bacterium]
MQRLNIKTIICLLLTMIYAIHASAQEIEFEEEDFIPDSLLMEQVPQKFSFINYDADSLSFPAGISDDFMTLLWKLADIKDGADVKINMIHIGGSHVQADIFSNRVRTNFSKNFAPATGSRGCLFPFATLNTNAPSTYRLKTTGKWDGARNISNKENIPLGIMGAAIRTSDPTAAVSLQLNTGRDSVQYDFNKITILGSSTSFNIIPVVICNGVEYTTEIDPSFSSYSCRIPYPATECTIIFKGISQGGSFTLRGIIPESDKPGVTYTACGVNGASVPKWLNCNLFTEELKLHTPELAIFAIGINDASSLGFKPEVFKEGYRKLLAEFKEANPNCCFIFITNNDCFLNLSSSGKYINPNTESVRKAFIELAEETQGAVFDVYGIMGGKGSSNKWVRAGLMNSDHVHFLRPGYNLLGDMLFNAINNEIEKQIP